VKALLLRLPIGDLDRILVGDPARIDAVHVDAVGVIVGGGVRVIMLSAAFAMLVCGCLVVLKLR
jgi:hypothetical protein